MITHANPPENERDHWEPVPPGTLAGIARRQQARDRNRQVLGALGLCVVCVLGIGMGWTISGWPRDSTGPNFGGITCQEVQSLLPKMLAGGHLPPEQASRVDVHLKHCPECRRMRDAMMSKPTNTARQSADADVLPKLLGTQLAATDTP